MPLPICPAPITPTRRISVRACVSALMGRFPSISSFPDFNLAELGSELRHRFEQVGDEAVIRNLEDRRLFVLVDGDDDLAVFHAGEMLDGARDADRDVELGGDD